MVLSLVSSSVWDDMKSDQEQTSHRYETSAVEKVSRGNMIYNLKLETLVRPGWLDKVLWPFDTFGMKVDGHTIAVTDVGSGPVLLFVHTGFWSFIWRDLIRRLSQNFRCICFDSPGTGLSDRVPVASISLYNAATTMAALIVTLGLKGFTLVVHDLGGPVGIGGGAKFAERVNGIAVLNAFAWKPADFKLRLGLVLMGSTVVRELDVFTGAVPRITSSSFGIGRRMDEPSRNAFRLGIGSEGLRAFHQYMRDAHDGEKIYGKTSTALSGPFRHLPLITIFGERNDPFRFQEHWKNLYPDATQVMVRKGNHFPMCDDPDFVAGTLHRWHREIVRSSSLST